MPSTIAALMKAMSAFSASRDGLPSTRPPGSRSVAIRFTGCVIADARHVIGDMPDVPQTAANSRLTVDDRPGSALDRTCDCESRFDHLVEADLAGVALSDGVGGDQPDGPAGGQQGLRAQEEVGHLVGAALRTCGKYVDQPVANVRSRLHL